MKALSDKASIEATILDIIDTGLALAGFKIMDGDKHSIIIRHCASDTDYKIKLEELVP